MTGVLLGRRLLAADVDAINMNTTMDVDVDVDVDVDALTALQRRIARDDRFFCSTMELIPAQFYFPTDEEENWLKSVPKKAGKDGKSKPSGGAKYHRDVLAKRQQTSTKAALKRAKFTPSEQKTNEERQLDAAQEEQQQKQQLAANAAPAKDPSAVSMDGLKERLALKLQAMREQRRADEKSGKKRKPNNTASTAPASKKRKADATSTSSAFNNSKKQGKAAVPAAKTTTTEAATPSGETASAEVTGAGISYGSLLLADVANQGDAGKKKTRNGQGVRGIKNLLKKAEKNQQRMEELKKTDEGRALVEAKGWSKAIKQASGEVVMDDPKLLRNKLKKKEKSKAQSSKEWKKRTALVEVAKKAKQKKRMENLRTGGKKGDKKDSKTSTRAGFEGKKGEGFLNAEKKPSGDRKTGGAASGADKKKKKH